MLQINPELYPYAVIKPKLLFRREERHLYEYEVLFIVFRVLIWIPSSYYSVSEFNEALLKVKAGEFDYIQMLVRAAKKFIKQLKKQIRDRKKNIKQKEEILCAKLPDLSA